MDLYPVKIDVRFKTKIMLQKSRHYLNKMAIRQCIRDYYN